MYIKIPYNGKTSYSLYSPDENESNKTPLYEVKHIEDLKSRGKITSKEWQNISSICENYYVEKTYKENLNQDYIESLPSGAYYYSYNGKQFVYSPKHTTITDNILELDVVKSIYNEFLLFKDNIKAYEDLGFVPRRGCLLYGVPGTGKTTLVMKLLQNFKDKDILIIFMDRIFSMGDIEELNKDSRLKIVVLEELNGYINDNGEASSSLLSLLDGNNSLRNTFVIATTNFPEKLPKNLINRQGRFDKLFNISYLSDNDVIKYMSSFGLLETAETLLITKAQYTISQLKEIVLNIKIYKRSVEEILDQLNNHKTLVKDAFTDRQKMGFNVD